MLEQQRGYKEEEVRSLKAEQQECGRRIQEFEAEVEKVTGKMEELQVSRCGCVCVCVCGGGNFENKLRST